MGVGSVERGRALVLPTQLIAQFPHVSYRLYRFDTFVRPFDPARIGLSRLFQLERPRWAKKVWFSYAIVVRLPQLKHSHLSSQKEAGFRHRESNPTGR